jgi:hypothetical protein
MRPNDRIFGLIGAIELPLEGAGSRGILLPLMANGSGTLDVVAAGTENLCNELAGGWEFLSQARTRPRYGHLREPEARWNSIARRANAGSESQLKCAADNKDGHHVHVAVAR